jgi:hypothetical protein
MIMGIVTARLKPGPFKNRLCTTSAFLRYRARET